MEIILKIRSLDGVYYQDGEIKLGYKGDKYTIQLEECGVIFNKVEVCGDKEKISSAGLFGGSRRDSLSYEEKVDDMFHIYDCLRNLSVRRFYKYVDGEDYLTELFIEWLQEQTYGLADKIILIEG